MIQTININNNEAGGIVPDLSIEGQIKFKGFASGANKYWYSTGVSTWAEGDITESGRALINSTVRADSDGNVTGVNFLTARSRITVYADESAQNIDMLARSDEIGQLRFLNHSYTLVNGGLFSTSGYLKLYTVGDLILQTDGGNVGVNNLLPERTLDVGGIARAEIEDNGGQVFNVKAYKAKGDGSNDDTAMVQSAVDALPSEGGIVFFPPGIYRITGNGFGTAPFAKNVRIVGSGKDATILLLDASATAGITIGAPGGASEFCSVESLTVTRAPGAIPAGSKGICNHSPSYAYLEDVQSSRHDTAIHIGNASTSLGVDMVRVFTNNSTHHIRLQNVAEVHMYMSQFGINGGETIEPADLLTIEGTTNDVRLKTCQFVPRVENNSTVAIKFVGLTGANPGYFRFEDINTELVDTIFASDATCAYIGELFVQNSRLTSTGKLWDWNAATGLSNLQLHGNAISFVTPSTIAGAKYSRFQGNSVSGLMTFHGGEWSVTGNTFTSTSTYSGVFTALDLSHNKLVFNASAPIELNVTGSGPITKVGNIADAGAQPSSKLLGRLDLGAGTSAAAQINLASSAAPTSPNNGDIWFDGSNIKLRVGGTTYTLNKS